MNPTRSARTTTTALGNFDDIEAVNNWRSELLATMRIFKNFISPEEEDSLFQEVEPYMKRLRYEYSHWDDVSIGHLVEILLAESLVYDLITGNSWVPGD